MRRTCLVVFILALTAGLPARAAQNVQEEMEQDVVLRALVDELTRNQEGLKLEDLQRPYFIEFGLGDGVQMWVAAELGAVLNHSTHRARQLRTDMRVGSYELDNTNFGGGYGWDRGGATLPVEDDYNAIRQAIWWATDRKYKSVVEAFEKKKAFMESKMIEDKPNDFSREDPVIHFEPRVRRLDLALEPLEKLAVALSTVFKDYPELLESGVMLYAGVGNDYLVNTEGTRLRRARLFCTLLVQASVQADDGMELADSFDVMVRSLDQLPAQAELEERCRKMAEKLTQVKQAPKLDAYSGPVLFEPEAAIHILSSMLVGRFSGGQRPVGSSSSPDDFEKKIGKRILPRSVNVVDDPTLAELEGELVMGHYQYDDQGVIARPVQLVEEGRLQALLMSRNPSKLSDKSTGHGRGGWSPRASVGCLMMTADDGADEATLIEELLEACADEDLKYGIQVTSLGNVGGGEGGRGGRGRGGGGSTPLVMHKVFPDGKEELVRGAQFAHFDLQAFKRLLAVGDKLAVVNQGRGAQGRTIAAPALLFEELDLAEIDRDFDKPPILPAPLARGADK